MTDQEDLRLFLAAIETAKKHPIGKIDLERLADEYSAKVEYYNSAIDYFIVSLPLYSDKYCFKKGNDGLYHYEK